MMKQRWLNAWQKNGDEAEIRGGRGGEEKVASGEKNRKKR